MEQNRENGNRGGHPGGAGSNESRRQNSDQGFEGMNYEQRRVPYFNKRQQQNTHHPNNMASGGYEPAQDEPTSV